MNFDLGDLLGLAFLFFFVILPAIQSFTRRGPQQDLPDEVEYKLPDKSGGETNLPRSPSSAQPPQQRPVAQQNQPTPQRPQPARPPARPPSSAPAPKSQPKPMVTEPPKPKPVQRGKTLEQLDNERLKRQQVQTPPAPRPLPPSPPPEVAAGKQPQVEPFRAEPDAILKGMVWQQVLNEPRGRHWNRLRRSKP